MAERRLLAEDSVPSFPRHVKFRFNEQRGQWVILAPEKVLFPDETAVEILKLCDGMASVAAIVDALAVKFSAPRDTIGKDVIEMLQGLSDKGVIVA